MKSVVFGLFLCIISIGYSQTPDPLSVVVTGTINTDCIGQGCFYDGPTILINEVMLAPATGNGSIYSSDAARLGEWIELYNPHKCESVDISCYFLGNNAPDGGNYAGGFSIPQGTVVPPQGFALIRGMNAAPVPTSLLVENGGNVVEVVVDSRFCIGSGGNRLWFPDAGGWFAFYDANGVPQDAISWGSQSNSCMTCPPCNSLMSDCGYTGALAPYNSIPAARRNIISSSIPTSNMTFARIPDGAAWAYNSPRSATYALCNSTCVEPPVISCNGTVTAIVSGGTPPYTYQWDDAMYQTTPTAVGLCAGTYTVLIMDFLMDTVTASYTVTDFVPTVSHPSSVYCITDSFTIVNGGLPLGGDYSCDYLQDSLLIFSDTIPQYNIAYTYSDTNGCSASANFTITVNPVYEHVFHDTICQRNVYNNHNFYFSSQQTDTVCDIITIDSLQTFNHCDSTVTLYLTIHPSEIFVFEDSICEGEDYANYGFVFSADTLPIGLNQYNHLFQNKYGCDSSITLNLSVFPVYDIYMEDSICEDIDYQEYGFTISADTLPPGSYQWQHQTTTAVGCDSSFTLTLQVFPIHSENYLDTICQSETYELHGFHLTSENTNATGDYEFAQNLNNIYGCDSIITLQLAITASPSVDFMPTPERVLLSENGGLINFLNYTDISHIYPGETYTWLWNFGDGNNETTHEYNIEHTYETMGEYLVTLTLTTSFGCSKEMSHYVYIEDDLKFPNIITPNGDSHNEVFAITNLNPSLPNILSIYNRWGKKVYEKENYQTYANKDGQIFNEEQGFNGENLSDGVYFYVFHYEGYTKAVDYHSSLTIIRNGK